MVQKPVILEVPCAVLKCKTWTSKAGKECFDVLYNTANGQIGGMCDSAEYQRAVNLQNTSDGMGTLRIQLVSKAVVNGDFANYVFEPTIIGCVPQRPAGSIGAAREASGAAPVGASR